MDRLLEYPNEVAQMDGTCDIGALNMGRSPEAEANDDLLHLFRGAASPSLRESRGGASRFRCFLEKLDRFVQTEDAEGESYPLWVAGNGRIGWLLPGASRAPLVFEGFHLEEPAENKPDITDLQDTVKRHIERYLESLKPGQTVGELCDMFVELIYLRAKQEGNLKPLAEFEGKIIDFDAKNACLHLVGKDGTRLKWSLPKDDLEKKWGIPPKREQCLYLRICEVPDTKYRMSYHVFEPKTRQPLGEKELRELSEHNRSKFAELE